MIEVVAAVSLIASPSSDSCAATSERRHLEKGDSVARVIRADQQRNATGIMLDSGGVYRMTAVGTWQDGDLQPTTPRGFATGELPWRHRWYMALGVPVRRVIGARWFELIGEVRSRRKSFFRIADGLEQFEATATGELTVFANDVNLTYGNNKGCITLHVVRLP